VAGLRDVFARLRSAAPLFGPRTKPSNVPRLAVRAIEDPFPFKSDEDSQRNHVRNHVVPGSVGMVPSVTNPLWPGWTVGSAYLGSYKSVMTQQVTGFEYDLTIVGQWALQFTVVLLRTPVALTTTQLFAQGGDQTLLYSREYKLPETCEDRKQFPFGFGAPSGWYCNVGEVVSLFVVGVTPGVYLGAASWVFGSYTLDFLQTFRQTVNR